MRRFFLSKIEKKWTKSNTFLKPTLNGKNKNPIVNKNTTS